MIKKSSLFFLVSMVSVIVVLCLVKIEAIIIIMLFFSFVAFVLYIFYYNKIIQNNDELIFDSFLRCRRVCISDLKNATLDIARVAIIKVNGITLKVHIAERTKEGLFTIINISEVIINKTYLKEKIERLSALLTFGS